MNSACRFRGAVRPSTFPVRVSTAANRFSAPHRPYSCSTRVGRSLAVGQVFYGPLSDRFGRRPLLLAALVLYGLASIGCAAAQSIDGLIAMRFLQALGGAGAIVLARAVVRDLYSGVRAGRELSLMGAITGFAPIMAPMIGGGPVHRPRHSAQPRITVRSS